MIRALSLVALLAVVPFEAGAADLDVRVERTRRVTTVVTTVPGLWRGHFSGGRNFDPSADKIALDWTDQVQLFPTDGECRRWIRRLDRSYRTYQGFSGCLRIR